LHAHFEATIENPMTLTRCLCVLLGSTVLFAARATADPLPPYAVPTAYQVKLRYDINAPRDLHIVLYDALIAHLKSLDFDFTPPLNEHPRQNRENPYKNDLSGVVAGDKALAILKNPSVASLLLVPEGFVLPAGDQPVQVRVQLPGGFPLPRQRELRNQTLAMLQEQGFKEGYGYDSRGYQGMPLTRLAGTIFAGQLELLLKDLRRQPTGWLAPLGEVADLPMPLRSVSPVLVIEVLADAAPPADPTPPEPRPEDSLQKLSADLWDIAKLPDRQADNVRVQIILGRRPIVGDEQWRQLLSQAAPSLFVEGQMSQIVSGLVAVADIPRLASVPEVSAVRLPRAPVVQVDPGIRFKTDNQAALEGCGLDGLQKAGHRGKNVRLAIIDTDFRGWDKMVKSRHLPRSTRLIDLTAEQNPDIYPAPMDGDELGHGTHCALAAALAAPQAEIALVRISATDPFQFQRVFDFVQNRPFSNDLQRRQDEIFAERGRLRSQRADLINDRKRVFENFEEDLNNEVDFGFLGAVRGWVFSERDWHQQWMNYHASEEKLVAERQERLTRLLGQALSLKGTHIVSSSLGWHSGYPMGGSAPLTRALDDRTATLPLWFQSAGNVKGQCWHGFFRDDNTNNAMEFAPPQPGKGQAEGDVQPALGHWSRELNFLAWQPYEDKVVADLPEKAKLRVSVQWREPHDAELGARWPAEDVYARPLAELRLLILRQRDPDARTLPADIFEVAAYSSGLPQRLDNQPGSATYEISAEFIVDRPGRYAVQIERQPENQWILIRDEQGVPRMKLVDRLAPISIQPIGETILPQFARTWELYPRVFVENADTETNKTGRPIFADFATDFGVPGVPTDARRVIAVGAANLGGQPQPYTALGTPMNRSMAPTPVVLMFDRLQVGPEGFGPAYGSNLATPFAAGLAACALSAGMSPEQFLYQVRQRPGKLLHASGR